MMDNYSKTTSQCRSTTIATILIYRLRNNEQLEQLFDLLVLADCHFLSSHNLWTILSHIKPIGGPGV